MRYDPLGPMEPADWLGVDEGERLLAIEAYHREQHVSLPSLPMHAAVHQVVENQLAMGIPAARRALDRLMAEGLDRHEALHAVGAVLSEHMFGMLRDRHETDTDAYHADLDTLTKESWRARFPGADDADGADAPPRVRVRKRHGRRR